MKCVFLKKLVLPLLFISTVLFAQTELQTKEFTGIPNFKKNFTFKKSNGQINSVKITVLLEMEGGYINLTNENGGAAMMQVKIATAAVITSKDVPLVNEAFQPLIADLEVSAETNLEISGNTLPFKPAKTSKEKTGYIAAKFTENFIGTGTFTIDLNLKSLFDFGNDSAHTKTFAMPNCKGKISIIYE